MNDPYRIIKRQHITEKTQVLSGLSTSASNACVARCTTPKCVFIVDIKANKTQIKNALMQIYKEQGLRILNVNTILMKPKKRRVRGRKGKTAAFKKAVITLEPGCTIDNL